MDIKQEILKIFQKNPEKYWKVEVFDREGYKRCVCKKCGTGFWSIEEREYCPNPSCGEEYGFIGNPISKKKLDYIQTWKLLEKFFVKKGHESIPRYPVVARWREDIYFNIASIVDFQRFDNGVMTFDYPANPLIVPQVCLRFNDLKNVGITGRHYTSFVMPGQHAFNYPKEGYWKDKTIELNFEFFTKELGIPKEKLIYVEELWHMPDFSALGPYIETYSLGLEMVNSGFMEFSWKNGKLEKLPMKVVDVGWGLERLVWFINGTPTSYDVVFGKALENFKKKVDLEYDEKLFLQYAKIAGSLDLTEIDEKIGRKRIAKILNVSLEELERKVLPIQSIYAILDHSRTALFAIADGVLPSNIGAGYFIRVVIRRALGLLNKFNWEVKLEDLVRWHIDYLSKMFPELKEREDEVITIVNVEEKKWKKSRENAKRIIEKLKKEEITEEKLVKIYETYGITPEDLGIEASSFFYKKLEKKPKIEKKKIEFDISNLSKTKILFYDDIFEFKAKVLKVFDGNWIVLDKTAFYPKSGGQDHDKGYIDGKEVLEVIKIGNVILHKVSEKIEEGKEVNCKVDEERRKILTQHHDAVHIVNGIVKKVIGSWCNQYGAEKTVEKARLDITHFENLSEEQIEKIEEEANKAIEKDLPINKFFMNRLEAERKYGFRIYQGGYVPSKVIRIVEIPSIDIEACSGTHGNSTKEVELIKILRTRRIADGLIRIELVAGKRAKELLEERKKLLEEIKEKIGKEDIVEGGKEIFERWKKLRKEIKKLKK
ncbi:MAG: alanine--tRNA ligase [Candidatus Aenigmarchaeota archaeon ex4484_224]|nr:MAG: alanine--tRNA ligase [Candidatus Aenigmarchaeota archaeon ex4484_224]